MKYLVILTDGAADYPIEELGGQTPLQYAKTPFIDELAQRSIVGKAATIPEGFPPGSDVANLSVLGYDPAITQTAYRIGDSITNPLSPLFYYFPLILGFARRYEKDTGMGTIIANMMPYSLTFTITWIILLIVWIVFDLPLGPGGRIFLH